MRKESEPLVVVKSRSLNGRLRLFTSELGDRARDGVVQTSIQHPKVFRADWRSQLDGQLGDGLTDVAVVVDDLRHREPLTQQVVAVQDGAFADLRARRQPELQRID
jgi:hypothetical protein